MLQAGEMSNSSSSNSLNMSSGKFFFYYSLLIDIAQALKYRMIVQRELTCRQDPFFYLLVEENVQIENFQKTMRFAARLFGTLRVYFF